MKTLDVIVSIFLLIGALNWGFVGFSEFNLITAIFGEGGAVTRAIYAVIGLSALYEIGCITFGLRKTHERWCETLSAIKH